MSKTIQAMKEKLISDSYPWNGELFQLDLLLQNLNDFCGLPRANVQVKFSGATLALKLDYSLKRSDWGDENRATAQVGELFWTEWNELSDSVVIRSGDSDDYFTRVRECAAIRARVVEAMAEPQASDNEES